MQNKNNQQQIKSDEAIPQIPHAFNQQYTSVIDNNQSLKEYKRKLLQVVVGIFVICVLIIVERIFYEKIISSETSWISSLQSNWDLITMVNITTNNVNIDYATFNNNGYWTMLGGIDDFRYNFLLITHFFITIYVGIDAIIAIKSLYLSLIGYFLIACIGLLYQGPRPYWMDQDISTSYCLRSYGYPSRDAFVTLFIVFFTLHCFLNKSSKKSFIQPLTGSKQFYLSKFFWWRMVAGFVIACYFFQKYITGLAFITSIFLSVLYFILYFFCLIFMDNYIDSLIRKSSVTSLDAKKYVFYWFMWLILAEVVAVILYSGSEDYMPIEWIQNFLFCKQDDLQDDNSNGIPYNELMGPWYSFVQTTVLFALIAGIFGIAHCFRHMKEFDWYSGTLKLRIQRIIIANIFLAPFWVLACYLNDIVSTDWVRLSGLNEYFIDAIQFFIMYFWLFGLMPLYVFEKLHLVKQGKSAVPQQKTLSFAIPKQQASNAKTPLMQDQQEQIANI